MSDVLPCTHIITVDLVIQMEKSLFVVVVIVATQPLPRDGDVVEDHGAPEAGKLSRAWTKARKEIESRQKASSARSS